MRLSATAAAERAMQMQQDWENEEFQTYTALARAYDVSIVYARKCVLGERCVRTEPPKGKRKLITILGLSYYVYRDGRVWSVALSKTLVANHGKIKFSNKVEGTTLKTSVARIVLSNFDRKPLPGELARHKDVDRTHNHIDNLVWGTKQDNMDDKLRNGNQGRGEGINTAKMVASEVIAFVNGYDGSTTKKAYCQAYAAAHPDKAHSARHLFNVLQKSNWKHLWDGRKVVDPKIVKYIRKKAQETDMPLSKFYRRCADFLVDKGYQVNATTVEKIVLRKTWDSI